jgi:hypothetical protein
MFVKASSSSVYQPQNHVLFAWFVVLGVSRGSLLESLSFALYVKRQTPGKEKFYGIRQ